MTNTNTNPIQLVPSQVDPKVADRPDIRADGLQVLYIVAPYRTTDVLTTQLHPMPYGGVLLAAVLREAGAHVELVDWSLPFAKVSTTPPPSFAGKSAPPYYHFGTPLEECLAWLDANLHRFDVVGMYSGECAVYEAPMLISRYIRQVHGKPVVVGGPFASTAPDEVMARYMAAMVARNEGENIVVAAMTAAAEGKTGIVQGSLVDLESLPLPAWDLAPPERYPAYNGRMRAVLTVSRGCPWTCTFCSVWTVMSRKHRRLSRPRMAAELKHLAGFGVRYFSFLDDNLFVSRSAVDNVLGAIEDLHAWDPKTKSARFYVEEGMEVRIAAEPGVLERIVTARFDNVALGLETVNDEVREAIQKPYTRDTLTKAIAECRKVGVTTKAFYIIGFPGDTVDTVCADLVAFGRLGLDARPNNLKLYPGTEATNQYRSAGIVDDTFDWRLSSFWTPTNAQGLTYATIRKLKTYLSGIGFAAAKFGVRVFEDTVDEAIELVNAHTGVAMERTTHNGAPALTMSGSFFRTTPYRTMLECLLLREGADGAKAIEGDRSVTAYRVDEPRSVIQASLISAIRGTAPSRQETLWAERAIGA